MAQSGPRQAGAAPRAQPGSTLDSSGDTSLLLRMTYAGDEQTGSVQINSGPIVAWIYDMANPTVGAEPMGHAPLPPKSGGDGSPQWAICYPPRGGLVWTPNDVFTGSFSDFLTWLERNGGGQRTIEGVFAAPALVNMFAEWSR